ncbi:MAG: acyl-ACP--UDP-N-acetylglucosamine O-acyltransferase [Desulfosarcinaceae bacterium]|nr:acyl-ACP--UDP-N-acetylglucosamine O-acyltransferase [Desulfosarcinaceae bacterium]
MIHSTAIVSSRSDIAPDVEIGPYTIIGDHVSVGAGTRIGPHVVIDPHTTIGANCQIYQYAALGAIPQSVKFEGEVSEARIGDNTVIREFVTVHRGTAFGGGETTIGANCFLMAYTHIAHDCRIGEGVVMANNATLAGHIIIGDFATVGGLVAIHQFVNIGEYAFVGGKSAVVKDVPPYMIAAGDRAKLHGLNRVGLKRHGFSRSTLAALKKTYRILFRYGLTINEGLERVAAEIEPLAEVNRVVNFIKASERGVTR